MMQPLSPWWKAYRTGSTGESANGPLRCACLRLCGHHPPTTNGPSTTLRSGRAVDCLLAIGVDYLPVTKSNNGGGVEPTFSGYGLGDLPSAPRGGVVEHELAKGLGTMRVRPVPRWHWRGRCFIRPIRAGAGSRNRGLKLIDEPRIRFEEPDDTAATLLDEITLGKFEDLCNAIDQVSTRALAIDLT